MTGPTFSFRLACITASLVSSAVLMSAQTVGDSAMNNWDRVAQIPKTQQVEVRLWNRTELRGSIQQVDPDGLTFLQGQRVTSVRREDIARVTASSHTKGARRGLIIGLAVGGFLGVANGRLQGAGAGAGSVAFSTLIGVAIGAGMGATLTLYEGKRAAARGVAPGS